MASSEVAAMVAERVRAAVEAHQFPIRTGKTAHVGISIGLACFPTDGETAEELLTTSGRNMQSDKHARRLAPGEIAGSAISTIESFR